MTPVFLLTGFLGAGKTTLLNRMLTPDTALVINEFGLVAVDHDLVLKGREQAVVTSTGCICCAVGADLRGSLDGLLHLRAQGAQFSRVIVETTGLADPAPIINSLIPGGMPAMGLRDHTVARAFRLAGVITVVDLDGLQAALARPEVLRQIAMADHLVLRGALGNWPQRLRAINPGVQIHDAGTVDPARLLQPASYQAFGKGADVGDWLRAETHLHDLSALNRHGDVVAVPLVGGVLPDAAFQAFLDGVAALPGMLRIKGLIATDGDPRPLVVHGVGHKLYPGIRADHWPDGQAGTRLVVIGAGLDEDALRRRFAALTGPLPGLGG
ncbi:CobW family GTP-binding protein [Paracoccus laeviglucosivorans]|uniref:CobW family GTP-binding protein n=1 Tax=Paracoccus laeviglucosivorans TaxID=1197861 RepID=UPI00163DADE9|nr:GTP-binding protein [Paracoccus laeviglucosivorans]